MRSSGLSLLIMPHRAQRLEPEIPPPQWDESPLTTCLCIEGREAALGILAAVTARESDILLCQG
jgi:hypothetical protein